MSPRGFSDWNVQTGALAGSGFDVSENAARLGYPEVFNRLGRVTYWELFGTNISPWDLSGSGAGNAGALDTGVYLWKPASLRLTPGTDVNQFSQARREIPLTRSGKIGLATAIYFPDDNVDIRVRMDVFHPTAPERYEVRIEGDGSVSILDGDTTTFVSVASIGDLGSAIVSWVFIKLVVDWTNSRYERLQVNDATFDLSATVGDTHVFVDPPHLDVRLFVIDESGGGNPGYFDFIAVTIDEP